MANVVAIIGNGFDLNLGMPTSYQDFLQSKYFPESTEEGSLAWTLRKKADSQLWVDIELELAEYSRKNAERVTFEAEYQELRVALSNYINSLEIPSDSQSTHAAKLIQKIAQGGDFKIVNFNYTSTVKQLLSTAGLSDKVIMDSHLSIHGTSENGDIIFGVNDQSAIPSQHEFLYKSSMSATPIPPLFPNLIKAHEIHFFGHSLGLPDHMYFQYFFQILRSQVPGSQITFHHFGEQGKRELFKQVRSLASGEVFAVRSNGNLVMVDVS